MHINEFDKGDIITRVVGIEQVGIMCNGLVGRRLKYVGIANGCIYYNSEGSDRIQSLVHSEYNEGWEKYIDPSTL